MTITEQTISDVEGFAVPELAVEFADTLCRFWTEERECIRNGTKDPGTLYTLLDSLTSVVLEG